MGITREELGQHLKEEKRLAEELKALLDKGKKLEEEHRQCVREIGDLLGIKAGIETNVIVQQAYAAFGRMSMV